VPAQAAPPTESEAVPSLNEYLCSNVASDAEIVTAENGKYRRVISQNNKRMLIF
jgi:hypothetical protein